MKPTQGLRTWIEINEQNLAHNVQLFKQVIGEKTKLMAVVKSNAYGHGLYEFSLHLEKLGVDWLGVDSITEAVRLRKEGVQIPILVLGFTLPERVREAVENNIILTLSSLENAEAWVHLALDKKINVHIKVDTGLHRQGFLKHDQQEVVSFLKKYENTFDVVGLFTHFAQAKDPQNQTYTKIQIDEFTSWAALLKHVGYNPLLHTVGTAGVLNYPDAHFDMVRVGAGIYGIWPSQETQHAHEKEYTLKPVLSWKTIISETKRLPQGAGISYNLTEVLSRDSVIAVCPIGYWHGFPRSLSSVGEVIVQEKKAKVLGVVAMDMIVIDITGIPDVKMGEEVTLIGTQIPAEDVAKKAGTTSYEILTRLNPLVKKIYQGRTSL